jgi:hypothetical protein
MYVFHLDSLAHPHEELIQRLPRRTGLLLWRNLHESLLGRMGVVLTEEAPADKLETWLRIHNIRAAIYEILDPSLAPIDEQLENVMRINGQRAGDLYIDVDADRSASMLRRGVPTLLLGDPYVLRKEWEDEGVSRPSWDELVAEMDRQAVLKSKKEWLEE